MLKTLSFLILMAITTKIGWGQNLVWPEVLEDIRARYPEVQQLSTDSLASWLDAGDKKQPILLDIREENEYAVSHLAGARHLPPDATDFSLLDGVPRDTPLVLYCSVGYRSSKMAQQLQEMGFTDVSNLEGSIFTWANEGRPVIHEGEPVHAVHPYNKVWGMLLKKELRSP